MYQKNNFNINNSVWKIISNNVQYDSDSDLKKFKQTYVLFDEKLNTRIEINTVLENTNGILTVQNNFTFNAWPLPSRDNFQIKQIVLKFSKAMPNKKNWSFILNSWPKIMDNKFTGFQNVRKFFWGGDYSRLNDRFL